MKIKCEARLPHYADGEVHYEYDSIILDLDECAVEKLLDQYFQSKHKVEMTLIRDSCEAADIP